jgi:hypothetical protein
MSGLFDSNLTDAYDQALAVLMGGTDNTKIGNVGDRLKVIPSNVPGGYVGIDFPHYQTHVGRSFMFSETFTIGLNAEKFYSFTTPDTTRLAHFIWTVFSKGEMLFRIHEAVTCTEGTTITSYNSNRSSAITSVNVIKNVSAVSNYGTNIIVNQFGAVSSNGNGGVMTRDEIIFKPNTKYLLYLKSLASSNNINPVFRWYEYDYVNDI